jgi:uncharacterized SAM-binding protein YcdF (DUF218 family)
MLFAIKKAIAVLLLPPIGPVVLALLGWLLWQRGVRRAGAGFMWLGLGSLLLLALPVMSNLLTWLVYDGSRYDARAARDAQALVIIGGGLRYLGEYGGDTLGRLSLERVRYAARLARDTGLPVLVTGGRLSTARSEAEVMREALETEYRVPVRWVEGCARNTFENAQLSADLLAHAGVSRILLVTHGVDARRARREFSAAGLEVHVAPTVIPDWSGHSPMDLMPSAAALNDSALALYEMLANAALSLGLNEAGELPAACRASPQRNPAAAR